MYEDGLSSFSAILSQRDLVSWGLNPLAAGRDRLPEAGPTLAKRLFKPVFSGGGGGVGLILSRFELEREG
jgi:hypothetical protein